MSLNKQVIKIEQQENKKWIVIFKRNGKEMKQCNCETRPVNEFGYFFASFYSTLLLSLDT